MEIKAAVCRATHAPVGIESIDIDQPLGREVLVRTVASVTRGRASWRPSAIR